MKTRGVPAAALVAASIATAAFGQTNAVRDFGVGFERFRQLGLPDVAGGVYGNLRTTVCDPSSYEDSYSRLQSMGDRMLKGNAWKVRDLGGGTGVYVKASGQTVTAMDEKTYEEWSRKRQEAAAKEGPGARATLRFGRTLACPVVSWSPTDVKKDAERLVKLLEKDGEEGDVIDEDTAGEVLLLAASLYRSGCAAEANRIADRVFKAQSDPKRAVAAAMNLLASGQYGQAYDRWAKSGDWARFHTDVSAVGSRFQSGWNEWPGAKRLLDLVKSRIEQPEPPPGNGEGLTDEDRQLARELALARPDGTSDRFGYDSHELWILSPAKPRRPLPVAATNDVIVRIKRRGMASVPMLVALLKDNTLTLRDRGQLEFGGGRHYRGSRAVSPDQVFRNMRRPATRGEVAQSLLRPLLPVSDEQPMDTEREDAQSLGDAVLAWHKEHGKKTVYELAKLYLEKGSSSQQAYAVQALSRVRDLDQKGAEIESLLLTAVRAAEYPPSHIHGYVALRREKAAEFVEKIAAIYAMTNAPATPPTRGAAGRPPRGKRSGDSMERHRRQFVEGLRAQVRVRPFRDVVAEIAAGTGSTQRATMALHQAIGREKPAEALSALLEAANKTDVPDVRGVLLGFCANVRHAGARNVDPDMDPEDDEGEAEASKPAGPDPALHAALWTPLLEDTRGTPSVREAAAWGIESLYAKPEEDDASQARRGLYEAVANLGEQGVELLVARARSLLAGTPPPDVPSASKVDDAARKKLVADLVAAADPAAAIAKLSADERLALVRCGRTNAVLNAKLRPVANRIVKVAVAPEFGGDAVAAQLKDRSLDREAVGELLRTCRALSQAGHRFTCSVTRRTNMGGVEVALAKPSKPLSGGDESDLALVFGGGGAETNRSDKAAHVDGWVMAPKHFARTSWPAVDAPAPVAAAAPGATDADRALDDAEQDIRDWVSAQAHAQRDEFWTAVENAPKKTPAFNYIGIGFEGYPALGAKAPAKP